MTAARQKLLLLPGMKTSRTSSVKLNKVRLWWLPALVRRQVTALEKQAAVAREQVRNSLGAASPGGTRAVNGAADAPKGTGRSRSSHSWEKCAAALANRAL